MLYPGAGIEFFFLSNDKYIRNVAKKIVVTPLSKNHPENKLLKLCWFPLRHACMWRHGVTVAWSSQTGRLLKFVSYCRACMRIFDRLDHIGRSLRHLTDLAATIQPAGARRSPRFARIHLQSLRHKLSKKKSLRHSVLLNFYFLHLKTFYLVLYVYIHISSIVSDF